MDVLSLIGIALAFFAIVGGNFLEGGELSSLVNVPAALLVCGGTVGAGLLQVRLPWPSAAPCARSSLRAGSALRGPIRAGWRRRCSPSCAT